MDSQRHGEVSIGPLLRQDARGPTYAGTWQGVPVAIKVCVCVYVS